jgi:hypothetical protein
VDSANAQEPMVDGSMITSLIDCASRLAIVLFPEPGAPDSRMIVFGEPMRAFGRLSCCSSWQLDARG